MQNRRPFNLKDDKNDEKEKHMTEQKEAVQKSKGAVTSVEGRNKEKEANDKAKRKQQLYYAFAFLLLGLLFSFAPQYIQTNTPWVVFPSWFFFIAPLTISFYYISSYMHSLYQNILGMINAILVFSIFAAIICYLGSVDEKPNADPFLGFWSRTMSYLFLVIIVSIVLMRLPEFFDFCKRNKDMLKSLFTVKNIFAAIGAVIVFLTALFQLMQIILQIIHH